MPRRGAVLVAAALVLVGAGALFARTPRTIDLSEPSRPAILGSQPEEQFGYALACGDIDGDGAPEVAVGAPGRRTGAGYHSGAVYVMRGGDAAGLSGPAAAGDLALFVIEGAAERARFGSSVAFADADGDGFEDLVVGAPGEGDGEVLERGCVYVFLSRPGLPPPATAGDADATLRGEAAGDALGSALLAADVDGDGADDLVASAFWAGPPARQGSGAVYVLLAPSLRASRGDARIDALADAVLEGAAAGDALRGLAAADVDGDGAVDLLTGAYLADGPQGDRPDAGTVYVVPAARLAAGGRAEARAVASRAIVGARERGFLGRTIACGDADGDGTADLLLPAYAAGGETKDVGVTGEATVLFGGAELPSGLVDLSVQGAPTFHGLSRWDLFGAAVLLSDLNGDGAADIVASAPFAGGDADSRPRCGEVYVCWGGPRSVIRAKSGASDLADVRVVGARSQDALGWSLLAVRANGAKSPDLFVGAPDARVASCGERCGTLWVVRGAALAGRPD
jgi:hypothetical protein